MIRGVRCVYVILLVVIFSHTICLCAEEVIWQIGRNNNSNSEFELPDMDTPMTVEYNVPALWADGIEDEKYVWEGFYRYICSDDFGLPPQQIGIQWNYSQDYASPVLHIRACANIDKAQRLVVYMNDQLIDSNFAVREAFDTYQFPLYGIRAGLYDENIITIKTLSISGAGLIIVDYLRLINGDSDGDGALDIDEPAGDMDGDEKENIYDPDTASVRFHDKEYVIFDLQEDEKGIPFFSDIQILDWQDISTPPPSDMIFCYGLFKINVQGMSAGNDYIVTICYPDEVAAFASFFLYDETKGFIKTDILNINEQYISIRIQPAGDQQCIIGGLSYPKDPQKEINEEGCFINSICSFDEGSASMEHGY
ncbi:MAG: hypothetical protein ACMUJM_04925 [bacterium]